MNRLRLYRNILTDSRCIEAHFPNLEHLELCNTDYQPSDKHFNEKNVKAVMRLNPQLRGLKIGSGCGLREHSQIFSA